MTAHEDYRFSSASHIYRTFLRPGSVHPEDVTVGNTNIELTTVSWYTATFSWSTNHSSTAYYELYCAPTNATAGYNRTVIIDKEYTTYTFWDLKPSVSYHAWVMNHFSEDISSLRSNRVEFITDPVPEDISQTMVLGQMVDIILILCLLGCWAFACFLFYKEWSSFHLQLPNRYTHYKNVPKGLEHVKVIKRAQDSVIYRNPNQSMSIKITERNRKLARMHTAPSPLVDHKEKQLNLSIKRPEYKRRTTDMT